jgi:hypothetical protein
MKIRDLVRLSMLNIGVLAEGEDPSASQLQDAISSLNMMLDTWSTQKLFIYSIAQEVFNVVGGQQLYTMGPGGNFNTTRPIYIETASMRIQYGTPQQIDIPLPIFNIDQWARISVKNTQSVFPTRLYFDTAYPQARLYFWPIPQQTNEVYITSWKPLGSFTTAEADFELPPAFVEAVMYSLATRLCPMYGKSASPEIIGFAQSARASLKTSLSKSYLMRADDGLLPPDKVFNYLTGE